MENENSKIENIENSESTFPEGSNLVIEEILKKYGLLEIQWQKIKELMNSNVFKERVEIFENLPGTKLSKLVKQYAEGKIFLKQIPSRLIQELNISEEAAKQMVKDLEENLLVFIKPIEEEKPLPAEVSTAKKPPEKLPEKPLEETKKPSAQKDIYREPIE